MKKISIFLAIFLALGLIPILFTHAQTPPGTFYISGAGCNGWPTPHNAEVNFFLSQGATDYYAKRRTQPSTTWTTIINSANNLPTGQGPIRLTTGGDLDDYTVSVGSIYEYQIVAVNANGQTATWNTASVVINQQNCIPPTPTPTGPPTPTPVPATPTPVPPLPRISNMRVINITANTATVTWTTDILADSQVKLCPSPNDCGNVSTLDSNPVLNHTVNVSGLTANSTYYYWVMSRSVAGRLATEGYLVFGTRGNTTSPTPSTTVNPSGVPSPTPAPTC